MSQDAVVRQRTSSDRKSPRFHDAPPVNFFSLVSPGVYSFLTLSYTFMAAIWYCPNQIPSILLNTPILGHLIQFLIAFPKVNLGLILFTIIVHTLESFFVVAFCWKHNFSISCTAFYIAQILYCGGFGLSVLFKYKPSNY